MSDTPKLSDKTRLPHEWLSFIKNPDAEINSRVGAFINLNHVVRVVYEYRAATGQPSNPLQYATTIIYMVDGMQYELHGNDAVKIRDYLNRHTLSTYYIEAGGQDPGRVTWNPDAAVPATPPEAAAQSGTGQDAPPSSS